MVTLAPCKCSSRDNSPTRVNSILAPKSKIWSQYWGNQQIMTQKTSSSFTICHIFSLEINYFPVLLSFLLYLQGYRSIASVKLSRVVGLPYLKILLVNPGYLLTLLLGLQNITCVILVVTAVSKPSEVGLQLGLFSRRHLFKLQSYINFYWWCFNIISSPSLCSLRVSGLIIFLGGASQIPNHVTL